jgi:cell division protein FtsZ
MSNSTVSTTARPFGFAQTELDRDASGGAVAEESSFTNGTLIKVIGVGGCGGNAVNHMIDCGVGGVEFIVANTDAQALTDSKATRLVQLGTDGLGAGSNPEEGANAAEAAVEDIRDAISGAQMLFITAGMGGGTGSGAAAVVARVAQEMGILTVGVVTKPFDYEGTVRMKHAVAGLEELRKYVNSMIVVLNDKLFEVYGDDLTFDEALAHGNDVLKNAVGGIAEIINVKGLFNVDFKDVRTTMSAKGSALMGTAQASGVDRALVAAQRAVECPLLEGIELAGAKGLLVNITASRKSLRASETRVAMTEIRKHCAEDVHVIFGTAYDESMGEELRVTVVVTGLEDRSAKRQAAPMTLVAQGTGTNGPAFTGMQIPSLGAGASSGVDSGMGSNAWAPTTAPNYDHLNEPTVWRNPRQQSASAQVESLAQSGVADSDIPAYLRKQAD